MRGPRDSLRSRNFAGQRTETCPSRLEFPVFQAHGFRSPSDSAGWLTTSSSRAGRHAALVEKIRRGSEKRGKSREDSETAKGKLDFSLPSCSSSARCMRPSSRTASTFSRAHRGRRPDWTTTAPSCRPRSTLCLRGRTLSSTGPARATSLDRGLDKRIVLMACTPATSTAQPSRPGLFRPIRRSELPDAPEEHGGYRH